MGSHWGRWYDQILFSGASMVLWRGADAGTESQTPRTQTTDNGKQNTYFSSLDNMVAQGNVLPVILPVKCAWGRGWLLGRSARQTRGTVVRLWSLVADAKCFM